METKSHTWGSGGVTGPRVSEAAANALRTGEEALRETAQQAEERIEEARSKLRSALDRARETCGTLQEKTKAAARATDSAVRENPYQSIGIAFGIGLLIGVLVNYQSRE